MMSTNIILLSPPTASLIIVPSQDVVLGLYYLTRERINAGRRQVFSGLKKLHHAYEKPAGGASRLDRGLPQEEIDEEGHARTVLKRVKTTAGRVLLSDILPASLPSIWSTGR